MAIRHRVVAMIVQSDLARRAVVVSTGYAGGQRGRNSGVGRFGERLAVSSSHTHGVAFLEPVGGVP